jgi:hypothetical protein
MRDVSILRRERAKLVADAREILDACQRARRGQLRVGSITAMLKVQLARPGRDRIARARAVIIAVPAVLLRRGRR